MRIYSIIFSYIFYNIYNSQFLKYKFKMYLLFHINILNDFIHKNLKAWASPSLKFSHPPSPLFFVFLFNFCNDMPSVYFVVTFLSLHQIKFQQAVNGKNISVNFNIHKICSYLWRNMIFWVTSMSYNQDKHMSPKI